MRFRLKLVIAILASAAFATSLVLAWPYIEYYQLTGSFTPIQKIETLHSPIQVVGWSAQGLRLADSRVIQLPGFCELPATSDVLTEATGRGVELSPDGRVFALVRINHWCGNDPVRVHVVRVDLADMLTFLGEGERDEPLSDDARNDLAKDSDREFSKFGWNIDGFYSFGSWQLFHGRGAATALAN
jgi:hypothetical protein